MMNKLIMPLMAGVGLLLGCAGMNSDFDCNTVAHDRCMTMEQANHMAVGKIVRGSANSEGRAQQEVLNVLPRLAPVSITHSPFTLIQSPHTIRQISSRQPPSRNDATSSVRAAPSDNTSTMPMYADTGITQPVRVNPTTVRLWIAGWIDSDDVFHQPSVVSFVAASDHWAGS